LTSLRQCLRHVDSAGPINAGGRIKIKATVAPIRYRYPMSNAETIRRIERFPFRRAPVAAEWRNKGYTLLHADTGASNRQAASLRMRQTDGNPLLVIAQGALGRGRPVREHRRAPR
jgi:hypothetical protein